ncbi:MAG: peptidoglycan DD-metalloendopeptidase family protein [bacterium]
MTKSINRFIFILFFVFLFSFNCALVRVNNRKEAVEKTENYHILQKGETIWRISVKYGVPVNKILRYNNIEDVTKLSIGQKIFIPDKGYEYKEAFIWPLHGKVTRKFNLKSLKKHHGIDIAAPEGTKIVAAQGGKVIFVGSQDGYGKMIVIRHGPHLASIYAHTKKNLVTMDQVVQQGDVVAEVGESGNARGPHLHFEIRKGKKPVDPYDYLPLKGNL